ncbi:MAG TPA: hypothetical protein VF711_07590, partial [Acidimicrobiales bacterium]
MAARPRVRTRWIPGVAQQALEGAAVEAGTVEEAGHGVVGEQIAVGGLDDHVEMGPVATSEAVALVVQEEATDVDEGIGAPGGRSPAGLAVDVVDGGQAQGGGQKLTALGVEAALGLPPSGEGARQLHTSDRARRSRAGHAVHRRVLPSPAWPER